MEKKEIIEIIDIINNFNPTDKGNVIILAIIMCILTVFFIRAINTTSIEEIFMDNKKKLRNDILKMFSILVVLVPTNFLLATDASFVLFEIIICVVESFMYMVYRLKERKINDCDESLQKLQEYYKDKQTEYILKIVICIMSATATIWSNVQDIVPMFNCVVVISVVEVGIIGMLIPEIIVKKTMVFLENEQEKIFIFRRMSNDTIICGNAQNMGKVTKYIIISLDELKTKEIHHQQYASLTKEEKKELCKKVKLQKKESKKKSFPNRNKE